MCKKIAVVTVLLIFVSGFDSCEKETAFQTVSKNLLIASKTIGAIQTTVLEAEKQGVISTESKNKVMQACVKINVAGIEATQVTRTLYNQQLPADKLGLIKQILTPVIESIEDAVRGENQGADAFGIEDEGVRLAVITGLNAAATVLKLIIVTQPDK